MRKLGVEVPDCAATVKVGILLVGGGKYILSTVLLDRTKKNIYLLSSKASIQRLGSSILLLRLCKRGIIFLSNSVTSINNSVAKAGTCPHGVAPGACPICSNMGGGGLRPGERVQKPGEMSYHECAMIGAMMRAREAAQKEHELNLANRLEALKAFEQNMINLAQKIADFTAKIQNNILLKPAAFAIKTFVLPIVNLLKNIPNIIQNINEKFAQIKEKFIDIQDKLNAIFGEAKAFVEKKVSELVSNIKSKLETLFKVFKRNNTKDDETKIDEDKKIFRLKTFIQKILRKKKDDSKD